jgi:hypothetical protein
MGGVGMTMVMLHLVRGAGGAERGGIGPLHLILWWLLCRPRLRCLYLGEEVLLNTERFEGISEGEILSLQAWELQAKIVTLRGRACIVIPVHVQIQAGIRV